MEQHNSKMKQHESPVYPMSSTEEPGSRVAGVVPSRWESQPGRPKSRLSIRHDQDSGDEAEVHEPRVVALNLKASLMGVHILDDDEELFFSRQSSMSSMISDKFREAGTVPFKWEAEPGKPIDQPKQKIDAPQVPLIPPPGSRSHSGVLYPQPLGANFGRPQSGMLFPHGGATTQSDASHPAAGRPLSGVSEASTSGPGVNLTEKTLFKKLVWQSKANDKGRGDSGTRSLRDSQSDFEVREDESDSPVSTLDLRHSNPVSPSSSERSFRHKWTRKSLRGRNEDAVAAQVAGPVHPTAPRPKSQLAQYLMSLSAMSDSATDDEDVILEGPSEVAWHQPEELQYHPELPVVEGYRSYGKRPTHERWTANSSSWNLSLVQKPLKTVSTIVNRSKHHHTTAPAVTSRISKRGKDGILPISLRASYDGGLRDIQRGMKPEKNSGRSRWPDYGTSGRNNYFLGSGRLQIDVAEEPDLEEPDMEQASNVNRLEMDDRDAVDEENFPFNSPIASSFVFREADKKRMSTDGTNSATRNIMSGRTFGKLSIGPAVGEYKAPHMSSSHDPNVRSMTDSESSHVAHLARDAHGILDQPPQWVPTRSFSYVKEVVDAMGLSSRELSGYLEIGGSGRFSIDLESGPRLEYKDQAGSPDHDVSHRLRPSRRSILSPCLPFLDKHRHRNVSRTQQAPAAAPAPIKIQPVNSFLARLGPVSEVNTPAGNFQFY